mgnify:CR=1 FL=1
MKEFQRFDRIGTTPHRSYYIPFAEDDVIRTKHNILDRTSSSRFTSLDGVWQIKQLDHVEDFDVNEKYLPSDIEKRVHALDVSPFIDPKTNKKYIYWSWFVDGAECKQEIFGMEMIDWLTPNYSTVTQLTELNKISLGSDEQIFEGDHDVRYDLNEAPFMYYRDDTYFLTFSVLTTACGAIDLINTYVISIYPVYLISLVLFILGFAWFMTQSKKSRDKYY